MPKVMTNCPATGQSIATHAVMTAEQVRRLKTTLAVFCPLCKRPHLATRDGLWLEDLSPRAEPGDASTGVGARSRLRTWAARFKTFERRL